MIKYRKRQRIRNLVLISSLLLFPITMNYLSPYIILFGASQGIISGSMVVFGLLFISSSHMWCSWLCPAGGLGEVCILVNDNPVKTRWLDTF